MEKLKCVKERSGNVEMAATRDGGLRDVCSLSCISHFQLVASLAYTIR